MLLRALLAAASLAAALPAFATPQLHDGTDMWFNPAESGWGLNLIHQGETLFATLFVYGPDGQPKWYVSSDLSGGDDGPLHDRPAIYGGALYECTGPWFGGPFNPATVSCRQVGTMRAELAGNLSLDYTVDGVRVTKLLNRFAFRATSLAGSYAGFTLQPAASGSAEIRREQAFDITDNGTSVTLSTQSPEEGACTWTGAHGQDGQYEAVSGTFTCGARSGGWSMRVDPTSDGFTGTFSGDGITSFHGRVAAGRKQFSTNRGNGYRSDMWFNAAESGWGVNMIEQGDSQTFTLFGTLFVYDAQGRPRWYVASELARHDIAGDEVSYEGVLFEQTGPYFGGAFNPSAVTRRPVGNMFFTTFPGGRASLGYTVDGVSVTKTVDRFAFRKQVFSGTYWGHQTTDTGTASEAMMIGIDDGGSNFVMQTSGNGICNYVAPLSQWGRLRIMSGTFSCNDGRSGPFTMSNAEVSFSGFTARFQGNGIVSGHIEGVRREAN